MHGTCTSAALKDIDEFPPNIGMLGRASACQIDEVQYTLNIHSRTVLALLRSLMDGEEVEYEVDHKVGVFGFLSLPPMVISFLVNGMT